MFCAGWIGISVFFLPVACLVIANFFFWRSTAHIISRISSFGRIHDKLKYRYRKNFLKSVLDSLLVACLNAFKYTGKLQTKVYSMMIKVVLS